MIKFATRAQRMGSKILFQATYNARHGYQIADRDPGREIRSIFVVHQTEIERNVEHIFDIRFGASSEFREGDDLFFG